jgi:hypothetical protein
MNVTDNNEGFILCHENEENTKEASRSSTLRYYLRRFDKEVKKTTFLPEESASAKRFEHRPSTT